MIFLDLCHGVAPCLGDWYCYCPEPLIRMNTYGGGRGATALVFKWAWPPLLMWDVSLALLFWTVAR